MVGWTPLSKAEYNDVWDRFYADFEFRPSMDANRWPGIKEPKPSITFHFTYDDEGAFDDYESWALARLRELVAPDQALYALDWQHPAFWFHPHQTTHFEIPAFPEGDYYIFLTQDFSNGIFGHPWEQTICIFGDRLVAAARDNLPRLLSEVYRANGDDGTSDREQAASSNGDKPSN